MLSPSISEPYETLLDTAPLLRPLFCCWDFLFRSPLTANLLYLFQAREGDACLVALLPSIHLRVVECNRLEDCREKQNQVSGRKNESFLILLPFFTYS